MTLYDVGFVGAWNVCFFSAGETSMPIKFLVLGAGEFWVGGGKWQFDFLGRGFF